MSVFRFKQFSIQQKQSAAKVGTDGVLLGAWVKDNQAQNILDIGCGTGVISLMMAQRFPKSQITAIEIDEQAYQEALINFKNSLWYDRLNINHTSFQKFNPNNKFDLIISNPPFYREDTQAEDVRRDLARSVKNLPFDCLIQKSKSLLNQNGIFSVIIPFNEENYFIGIAKESELFPIEICRVKGTNHSPVKRSLISFTKTKQLIHFGELVIEKKRNIYTDDYKTLTQSFYLKM